MEIILCVGDSGWSYISSPNVTTLGVRLSFAISTTSLSEVVGRVWADVSTLIFVPQEITTDVQTEKIMCDEDDVVHPCSHIYETRMNPE